MKTRSILLAVLVMAILVAACKANETAVPTPHGDPLAPTPEVFNPLDPSPTPSGSDLPLTCQVTDLNVSIDRAAGYCFAYPKRFAIDIQPLLNTSAVLGSNVGHGGDTVQTTFAVQIGPYDPNILLVKQVDDFLRQFTAADPASLARVALNVAGEEAMMVDMVPVQLNWRLVFVPHNGQLYRLMYWPADVPEAKADLEELYQTTIGSFAFLSASSPLPLADATPTPKLPSFAGLVSSYGVMNLVVPPGIADGAGFRDEPRVANEDAAWWQKTPGHLVVTLEEYYILKGKSILPQIYVFPAKDYAELLPAAFESMHRLNNLFAITGEPIRAEELPGVPFFNAQQVFASNIQVITFQNGRGVRFLTEYAQYPASANNMDLFYEFQGLTNDGAYYIVASLPITFPMLAETSDAGAPLPVGGIQYPYIADPKADMQAYYAAVTVLLNNTSPESFTPTISQLDALIQSMLIKP
jgi:hypothetical protein